jgi:hypothetical protein
VAVVVQVMETMAAAEAAGILAEGLEHTTSTPALATQMVVTVVVEAHVIFIQTVVEL